MLCYVHQDRQAVGICKSCHKGLCPECAVEVTNGLACKGTCENEAKYLSGLIEANRASARGNVGVNALIYSAMAIILFFLGVMIVPESRLLGGLVLAFGVLFLAGAANLYRTRKRLPK